MVSRRAVLRTGGSALLVAAAGCAGGDGRTTTTTTTTGTPSSAASTSTATVEGATADGPLERLLTADRVSAAASVPDGATVVVATPELHELVVAAASADGRVDYGELGRAHRDQTFALGAFEYLRFRGETYESTASFSGTGEESTTRFELESADDAPDGDDDVIEYGALNESEREIADEMLEHGSFTVGRHEDVPDAARTFTPGDYLRVDGRTYRVQVAIGDPPPHHMLTLDASDPGEDAQVVTVADRVPEYGWAEAFRTAVETDDASLEGVENGDGLVEYVDGADYVVTATAVAEVGVATLVE